MDDQITADYITTNYREIIPDHKNLDSLKNDFQYLYENKLSEILEPEMLISILHKYGIIKYYKKMLEYLIWQIMNCKYEFQKLVDHNICADIIQDIINHNSDFTRILIYLFYRKGTRLIMEDFLFSIELLKLSPFTFDNYLSPIFPIKYGIIEVVKYLVLNNKCHKDNICSLSAEYGQLEILKFAREHDCWWDKWTCIHAASKGHFEILKWAIKNGCPSDDERICAYAAENGHFEILKWAHAYGCQMNEMTSECATNGGHFEILKWVREQGSDLTGRVCSFASMNNQLEILKWAREQGYQWDKQQCEHFCKKK